MSLTELRNVVLLFSNPVWTGSATVPQSLVRNITSLSGSLGRDESINRNLTTLTTANAETLNGVIQGLLYVPEIPSSDPCSEEQYDEDVGLPRNVTRKSDLPPTNYKLIAIAPFFRKECTKAYLRATKFSTVRGFIFYKTNNFTTKPPEIDNPTWDLDDGGAWIKETSFPIFAIPGLDGQHLVNRLSKYSGTIEEAPHGQEIIDVYGPNPRDYIRIWAELTLRDTKSLPALWTFFVIVIGSLLVIITFISIFLHMVQRRRRKNLYERVKAGEIDLEKSGICRVQVPEEDAKVFPVYTYCTDHEKSSEPATPASASVTGSRTATSGRTSRQADRSILAMIAPASRTRTSLAESEISTIPTNRQYMCVLCEDLFENRSSIIRQLPCKHIFHPECIDEYLTRNSSLCPICHRSMLREGYVPRITNGMVRRERALRRVQGHVNVEMEPTEDGKSKIRIFSRTLFRDKDVSIHDTPSSPTASPNPVKQNAEPRDKPLSPSKTTSPAPTNTPSPGSDTMVAASASTPTPAPGQEDTATPLPETQSKFRLSQPRTKKSRRSRGPRLRLDQPILDYQPTGRIVPTEETLARMREMAESNIHPEVEDIENKRPIWKKVVSKVFPGIV